MNAGEIARVGDQDDVCADLHEHQVHRQREHVIQRQRYQRGFLAIEQVPRDPRCHLLQVGHHVRLGQHCALGHAGGSACVLQEGQVIESDRHVVQRLRVSGRQRLGEADASWRDATPGTIFLTCLTTRLVSIRLNAGNMSPICVVMTVRTGVRAMTSSQRVCKVFQHDDRRRARVLQLMLEFARRVQWVSVHYHDARPLRAKQRDRVLQQVRQHDRQPVAFLQASHLLQVGAEVAAQLVQLAIGDRHAHVPVGGQVGEPRAAGFQDFLEGVVGRVVHFGRNPFGVQLQPGSLHGSSSVYVLPVRYPLCRWRAAAFAAQGQGSVRQPRAQQRFGRQLCSAARFAPE